MAPKGWTTPRQLAFLDERRPAFEVAKLTSRGVKKTWLGDICRDFFTVWKSVDDELEEWRAIENKDGKTIVASLRKYDTHEDWHAHREEVRFFFYRLRIALMFPFISNCSIGSITTLVYGQTRSSQVGRSPSLPIP